MTVPVPGRIYADRPPPGVVETSLVGLTPLARKRATAKLHADLRASHEGQSVALGGSVVFTVLNGPVTRADGALVVRVSVTRLGVSVLPAGHNGVLTFHPRRGDVHPFKVPNGTYRKVAGPGPPGATLDVQNWREASPTELVAIFRAELRDAVRTVTGR